MFIQLIYRKIIPKTVRDYFYFTFRNRKYNKAKKEIIRYYNSLPHVSIEAKEAINYLKKNRLCIFPYKFEKQYKPSYWKVNRDSKTDLPYVIHEGKKLFFKKSMSNVDVQYYYNSLRMEQDLDSPHRYLTSDFSISEFDTLVDIGAAEGILSLDEIDKLTEVYLFEPQEEWIEALQATFEPWKNKVNIIKKFVGSLNDEYMVTLDEFFKHKKVDFIKIDVEGYESDILNGGRVTLNNKANIKLVTCTYHKKEDVTVLSDLLVSYNFKIHLSKGYMIFLHQWPLEPPYLRKGVLRANRQNII